VGGLAWSVYDINRVFESGEFGDWGCMFIIQACGGWSPGEAARNGYHKGVMPKCMACLLQKCTC
jgi:hypothetical protein